MNLSISYLPAEDIKRTAKALAATMMERGYRVVSGGTENHLFLLDLIDKEITGKDAEAALGRANITVNKNAVPGDPRSPFYDNLLENWASEDQFPLLYSREAIKDNTVFTIKLKPDHAKH